MKTVVNNRSLTAIKTAAYAALAAKQHLVPFSIERRLPGPHDCLIDILYCGICHTDIHMVRNEWGSSIFPMVPGHEIIGKVQQVGSDVHKWTIGDTVGVGCFIDSCRNCDPCREGEEQYCNKGMTLTYNSLEPDGKTPTYGGYSKQITVNEDYILRIPDEIELSRAAPLLCAGITTYSPLQRFNINPGDTIAVAGLGGLGHMAVKIAKAMGADVTVLSRSPGKSNDALQLGADDYLVTSSKDVFKNNAERFDFLLDTISAPHDYNAYLNLLRHDGTMILVGLPGPQPLSAASLIMRRKRLVGSVIGGIWQTQEMLDFCADNSIAADVEVVPIQKVNEAFDRVVRSDVKYRFVIDMASLE
jgi:uncharacterized zinc-type alcohol dehydrogenase-like protein